MFNVRIQYSSESAINIKRNAQIITYNTTRDGINEHNKYKNNQVETISTLT